MRDDMNISGPEMLGVVYDRELNIYNLYVYIQLQSWTVEDWIGFSLQDIVKYFPPSP